MRKVIIVNEKDQPIGLKGYDELSYNDIYQVSALWLTDSTSGDCLITQRKWTKHNDPGKWMAAASGTIEENETYDDNMVHEIEEEIGLTNLNLRKGPKEFVNDGQHQYFVQWYFAEVNKHKVTIKIQKDEVEDYTWVSREQLIRDLHNNPSKFVPGLADSLKHLGV